MKKIFLSLAVLVCFSFSVYGSDRIIMKDGTIHNGNIHLKEKEYIFIIEDYDVVKLKLDEVEQILTHEQVVQLDKEARKEAKKEAKKNKKKNKKVKAE